MVAVRLLPDKSDPKRYFALFDLPAKLTLDAKDLEQRYFRLSRQWHPDLFARKSDAEREQALDRTALLNDAYRVLRNPLKRAAYVAAAADEMKPQAPPELLEEVFELNMALEELRSGDEDVRPQLEQQQQSFLAALERQNRDLQALFPAYDAGSASAADVQALLNRRKYIQNLVDEVEKALNARN